MSNDGSVHEDRPNRPSVTQFLARQPRDPLPAQAKKPRSLQATDEADAARGVVVRYVERNFTIYRAVVDRLRAGERLRIEDKLGAYELTADELRTALAAAVATPSYLTGTASTPGGCYYTWSRGAPPSMSPYRVGAAPATPRMAERQQLRLYVEELLIEAEVLAVDPEGITRLDGRRAPVRATRASSAEVGWECEVRVDGRSTGERRLADVYVVAEVAPHANDIVRLRSWDAIAVRPLLTGRPYYGVPGNFGWTHGLRLDLLDPRVAELAIDLTPRLW